MGFKAIWAGIALVIGLASAGEGRAQLIKPLDIERDEHGVDLLTGTIANRLPALSIPASAHLRLQNLDELNPSVSFRYAAGANGPPSYDVNFSETSEQFTCIDEQTCEPRRRNGASITQDGGGGLSFFAGGTGTRITFNVRQGAQGPNVTNGDQYIFFASRIEFADGESLDYFYDSAPVPGNFIWRRPSTIVSSTGYTMKLEYQASNHGVSGWSQLAQATIYATGNSTVPLARLTYNGDTVTDLGGRSWTCPSCNGWLGGVPPSAGTSLTLPGEATPAIHTANEQRSYTKTGGGTVTRSNLVTRVTVDGVDWDYSYAVGPVLPTSTISQVTTTGPNGYSRVVNVYSGGQSLTPRITSVRDSLLRTTSYEYDNGYRNWHRLLRVVNPDGSSEAVQYDAFGNIIERRRTAAGSSLPDLVETAYFPPDPRVCVDPSCFRPAWTRDSMGRQTDYTWSGAMMLTRLEPADPNGQRRKTINSWNGGRLTRERICLTDAAGVEQTCGTSAEQVREITYLGSTILPLSVTRTDGVGTQSLTTTYEYDAAGRLLKEDGPLAGTDDAAYYRYDAHGRRTWEIGPKGDNGFRNATRTSYRDADDRPASVETGTVTDASSQSLSVSGRIDYAYDARRNVVRETASAVIAETGVATRMAVTDRRSDMRGRLECEAQRMNPGSFGTSPHDACTLTSEPATGSNGPDRITMNVYDAGSRVTNVQRAVGTNLHQIYAAYTYDESDRRTSVTDANGNRAEMRYDGHGRQVRWVFPSAVTGGVNELDYEEYAYDLAGNRLSLRRRDGTTIAYTYDNLNRMIVKAVPPSAGLPPSLPGAPGYVVHYAYDVGNRQIHARFGSPSGEGVLSGYDLFGRLVVTATIMDGVLASVTTAYDPAGNRSSLTTNSGYGLSFLYDAAGRMTQIREAGPTRVVQFEYDSLGRRSRLRLGTGPGAESIVDYAYEIGGQLDLLTRQINGTGAGGNQTIDLDYNPASQITGFTNNNDHFASNTAYDVQRPYSTNRLNQYTQAGPASFTYDRNGNLSSDGQTTYVYDAENRLVSASGATNAMLSYDPLGRLRLVTGSSGTRRYVYDGDDLIEEYDGAGNRLRVYAHGPGADEPLILYELTGGPVRRYLHANHQGSIVAIAEPNANPIINAYDAWGIPNQTNQGRFGYTAQTWIPELGLWHYKARVYSPTLGRFLQTDPVGYDDQVNLYAYVGNDPLNRIDPTGTVQDSYELATRRDDMAYLQGDIDAGEYRDRQQARGLGGVIGAGILAGGYATRGFGIPLAARWLSQRFVSAAFRRAVEQYPRQLAQNLRMTSSQIQTSVRSFEHRIAQHQSWLRNPESKIRNWNQLSATHRRNILHHWRQDVRRHQAYRDIANGVLRDRSMCTGTRICR